MQISYSAFDMTFGPVGTPFSPQCFFVSTVCKRNISSIAADLGKDNDRFYPFPKINEPYWQRLLLSSRDAACCKAAWRFSEDCSVACFLTSIILAWNYSRNGRSFIALPIICIQRPLCFGLIWEMRRMFSDTERPNVWYLCSFSRRARACRPVLPWKRKAETLVDWLSIQLQTRLITFCRLPSAEASYGSPSPNHNCHLKRKMWTRSRFLPSYVASVIGVNELTGIFLDFLEKKKTDYESSPYSAVLRKPIGLYVELKMHGLKRLTSDIIVSIFHGEVRQTFS